MCRFVMRNGEMRHIPPSRGNFMPADITFQALFTNTRARLCSAVTLCFFFCVRFHGPVVCVRRRWATIAEGGSEACAWALWAVVWIPASLTDGWSLNLSFFLWLSCSVLPEGLPAIPPPPTHHLQMKTFPLVSRAEGRICQCVLEECIKRVLMCL